MSSYQYRDQPSYLMWESAYLGKMVFILRQGPCHNWIWQTERDIPSICWQVGGNCLYNYCDQDYGWGQCLGQGCVRVRNSQQCVPVLQMRSKLETDKQHMLFDAIWHKSIGHYKHHQSHYWGTHVMIRIWKINCKCQGFLTYYGRYDIKLISLTIHGTYWVCNGKYTF